MLHHALSTLRSDAGIELESIRVSCCVDIGCSQYDARDATQRNTGQPTYCEPDFAQAHGLNL